MKKFFSILIVAILVIGCAFATTTAGAGTGSITLTTTIAEVEPTFQIKASDGDIVAAGATGVGDTSAEVTLSKDLSETGATSATVVFTLYQISDAKMFGGYSLTVAATDLVAVQPSEVDAADWAEIDEANKKFSINSTTPTVVKHADYASNAIGFAKLLAGSTDNAIKVTYLGVLKATSDATVELGTFTCTWGANAKAIVGDYEATITLTVAAN